MANERFDAPTPKKYKNSRRRVGIAAYSLEELQKLVREKGITQVKQYKKLREQDPLLPRVPSSYYADDWKGWNNLFGKAEFYSTLEDAIKGAQALKIKGFKEYKRRRREDPRLPSDPAVYYRNFPGYLIFLGVEAPHYPTYTEASEAAVRLKISSKDRYSRLRNRDTKLPAIPSSTYPDEWQGWAHFLNIPSDRQSTPTSNNSYYKTYAEFKDGTNKLGIKNQKEYYLLSKKDPRLPGRPDQIYYQNWQGWGHVFNSIRSKRCATWQEAKAIALPYRFTSATEYRNGYKVDDRLPCDILKKYPDCPSFTDFLLPDEYATLEDLKVAAKVLKIKSKTEYKLAVKKNRILPPDPENLFRDQWISWEDTCGMQRYSYNELRELMSLHNCKSYKDYKRIYSQLKDPLIPFKPAETYENWPGFIEFCGKEPPFRLEFVSKRSAGWVEDISEFLDSLPVKGNKESSLTRFIRNFVEPNNYGANVQEFLTLKAVDVNKFRDLLTIQGHATYGRRMFFEVNAYLDYSLRKHFTVEDEDTGEIIRIEGAANPFALMEVEGGGVRNTETGKPALAYQFVESIRKWIAPDVATNFNELKSIHQFNSDYYEVDASLIDENDPDCVYRRMGSKYYLWYPGHWMALYTLVSVPARGRQIMYNDSGEADEYIVELHDGKPVWLVNANPLALKDRQEAFVLQTDDSEWGMHFTSNKTSYEGEGYSVPWIPEKLIYWITKLRNWQTKYNPISRITPWSDCANRTNLSRKKLKRKGANCFLFRGFGEDQPPQFANPMTTRLAAALFYTQPEGLVLAKFNPKSHHSTLIAYETNFTPHCMRVSLITAYVLNFGIPTEIIMKIVGHASIVMSIYYVKIGSAKMRQIMADGEKRALLNQACDVQLMIEQNRLDELTHHFVANSEEALAALMSGCTGTQLVRDYGICPYAGTRCDDGGSKITETHWAPTPAGYLGIQNCPRCRHLVSSPVFLGGLVALWNEISLKVNLFAEHYGDIDRKIETHREMVQKYDYEEVEMEEAGKSFDSRPRLQVEAAIRKLQGDLESAAKKMDMFLCDMQAVTKLINDCKAVLLEENGRTEDTKGVQLILNDQSELIIEFEETSMFRQLNEVCVNATIYQSSSAEFAIPRRSQMIDRMTLMNNLRPVMCNLSEHEQLILGNQVTDFFFSRLKNWDRVENIMNGDLLIEELTGDEKISTYEFSELLSSEPILLQNEGMPVSFVNPPEKRHGSGVQDQIKLKS